MRQMRLVYPVPLMCRIAGVSASGYYSWLNRPPSQRSRKEGRLETEIRAAYKRTRETYGPERLQRDLAEHGIQAGVCQIGRIRKKPARFLNHGSLTAFAKMLERHRYGILSHRDYPVHNGKPEGVNNKIKVIRRKACGFHDLRYFTLKIHQAFSN